MILNDNEINTLICLINETNKNIGNEFELIYRGSRDGWYASDFHKNCDNKGKTLSIIHTDSNNVFGGYTSIPWTNGTDPNITYDTSSFYNYVKDCDAFLFLIRSKNNYKSEIFSVKNANYAVEHSEKNMCIFGGGAEIEIKSQCNIDYRSYTNATSNYYNTPIDENFYLNAQERYFKVIEIEIYLCK